MINLRSLEKGYSSWEWAVDAVAEFNRSSARLSHLMEHLPEGMDAGTRRSSQALLFGTIRHIRLLEKGLDGLMRKRPKPGLWAVLLLASYELLRAPEKSAKIVHHAVFKAGRRYSRPEKGLANAVLRKVPKRLEELLAQPLQSPEDLSWRYSHPQWMIERWLRAFGWDETIALLEWNQREPETFGRWQGDEMECSGLEPTEFAGFYRISKDAWGAVQGALKSGDFYIQNPAARLAAGETMAALAKGGRALDLCSAPGGKAMLVDRLLGDAEAEILAIDLPGPRFERMNENFQRYGVQRIRAKAMDVMDLDPAKLGRFEVVLLDAPCSNSGVLQHKVDARWRLSQSALQDLIGLQLKMLEKASAMVAPGGRLVYSTCSIEQQENEELAQSFLQGPSGSAYSILKSNTCLPWKCGHDGAGVVVLQRD